MRNRRYACSAVLEALDHDRFRMLDRIEAPQATRKQLARVRDDALIDHIFANAPHEGWVRLDADTLMSPGSQEAALRAAGAVCAAVDAVLDGATTRAFLRGATAGPSCNARYRDGLLPVSTLWLPWVWRMRWDARIERVAIVDFDVHHGNGSQDIFWDDALRVAMPRRISRRCILEPVRAPKPAWAISSTPRCHPALARPSFVRLVAASCCRHSGSFVRNC